MRYREFARRQTAFALAHPWRYAVIGGALALLLLLMLGLGVVVSVLGGAAWYVVTGISLRYGPGRQIATKRLARLSSRER